MDVLLAETSNLNLGFFELDFDLFDGDDRLLTEVVFPASLLYFVSALCESSNESSCDSSLDISRIESASTPMALLGLAQYIDINNLPQVPHNAITGVSNDQKISVILSPTCMFDFDPDSISPCVGSPGASFVSHSSRESDYEQSYCGKRRRVFGPSNDSCTIEAIMNLIT